MKLRSAVVFLGTLAIPAGLLIAAVAQTQTAPATKPKQASSQLVFRAPKPITLKGPTAFNLCNGQIVRVPGTSKHPDWNGLQQDIGQKQCGGSSGTQPTSISGGDGGPYTFQLESGSFPPLGMHLGLNGLLYGTPTAHGNKLLSQGPFRVCAVQAGGESSCDEVKLNVAGPAGKGISRNGVIALGGIGAAGAVGAAVAASSLSSTPGSGNASCTMSAPVQCGAFGPGDPPGCVQGAAFVSALQSYCSCYGFPSGYSLGAGVSCP